MFLSKPGEFPACELFSIGHLILFIITIVLVGIALFFSRKKNQKDVLNMIKVETVILWILEILKIIFNLKVGNASNPNTYIPLYYCSLILYAGILSGFCRGKLKRVGDVFLSTGAIIAGICFLICPNTSLSTYPMLHFISLHSFFLHGTMVYLGLLVNITNYIELKKEDIKYYFTFISIIGIIALIFNSIFGSNLMFISDNFPNTPIEIVYNLTGEVYPAVMILVQAIVPFYIIYFIRKLYIKRNDKKMDVLDNML